MFDTLNEDKKLGSMMLQPVLFLVVSVRASRCNSVARRKEPQSILRWSIKQQFNEFKCFEE